MLSISGAIQPLTWMRCGGNLDPPLDETHRSRDRDRRKTGKGREARNRTKTEKQEGRPAGLWRVKRTASTQVVQSASPRPGSAKKCGRTMRVTRKGHAIPGDRRSGVEKERREKDPRPATEGQNGCGAGRSWKGLGGSAVLRKRSSDTFTGRGGASLPCFILRRKN